MPSSRSSPPARRAAPAQQATLVARSVSHDRGGRTVLRDVSLTVGPQSCVGVTGPNGVGKTTLLRLLAGLEPPDAGSVTTDPPTATVGYLAQEHERVPGETVRALLARRTGARAAEDELEAAAAGLSTARRRRPPATRRRWSGSPRSARRPRRPHRRRARRPRPGRGPGRPDDGDALRRPGGQGRPGRGRAVPVRGHPARRADQRPRLRRAAAPAVLGRPPVRRHGDRLPRPCLPRADRHDRPRARRARPHRPRVRWWLVRLPGRAGHGPPAGRGGLRPLPDDPDRRTARGPPASASGRPRGWPARPRSPRDNDKAQRDFRINRTEKLASKARQTERALASLEEVAKPWEGWDLRFSIEEADRAGDVVARLDGAVVERGSFVLGPLDLEIAWGDRVALTGPNGSGKSTLVGALLGRVPLTAGERWFGPSVVAGVLGQDRRALGGDRDLVREVCDRCGVTVSEARSLLAKFGLEAEQVTRPAGTLSPGERTRAELAVFQALGVNLLVLDEPTNHLDLPAIEQLESALGPSPAPWCWSPTTGGCWSRWSSPGPSPSGDVRPVRGRSGDGRLRVRSVGLPTPCDAAAARWPVAGGGPAARPGGRRWPPPRPAPPGRRPRRWPLRGPGCRRPSARTGGRPPRPRPGWPGARAPAGW